jgi:hypothetical protein
VRRTLVAAALHCYTPEQSYLVVAGLADGQVQFFHSEGT